VGSIILTSGSELIFSPFCVQIFFEEISESWRKNDVVGLYVVEKVAECCVDDRLGSKKCLTPLNCR